MARPAPSPWFRRWRCGYRRLARRRILAVTLVGVIAFGGSAALTAATGPLHPRTHDEFSYLLLGDTFAEGRLTNPPLAAPLWEHFETFHVLVQPTYASKYPPLQGVFLAVGQVTCSQPIVGVWLSVALTCAALTWMLQGWTPPRWALAGGLLSVAMLVFLGTPYASSYLGYWSQSYWGGAPGALGGALVFGAWRRLWNGPQFGTSLGLGLGLAALALSRPFEGLLVSLVPVVSLGVHYLGRGGRPLSVVLARWLVPLLLVLIPTVVWMGYYNGRVTHDPLRLPYQVHEDEYGMVPVFVWQPLRPEPPYRHDVLRLTHAVASRDHFLRYRTWDGCVEMSVYKVLMLWKFYIDLLLTPAWVALLLARPRGWTAAALGIVAIVLVGSLLSTWAMPHYLAPITGLMFFLDLQAVRQLRRWGLPGRAYAALLPILFALMIVGRFVWGQGYPTESWHFERARIEAELATGSEKHVIFVRYGPGHETGQEWVYNRANLDAAKVVWAHDMGDARNRELLKHYRGRTPWLLEPATKPVARRPYLRNESVPGTRLGDGR